MSRPAHEVWKTLYGRHFNVLTSLPRSYDVALTPSIQNYWKYITYLSHGLVQLHYQVLIEKKFIKSDKKKPITIIIITIKIICIKVLVIAKEGGWSPFSRKNIISAASNNMELISSFFTFFQFLHEIFIQCIPIMQFTK